MRPRLPDEPGVRLFLCGDVMIGRGIDQLLPHPSEPVLYEPYIKDARDYVLLAEEAHGPLPRAVEFAYVWGDALDTLKRYSPHARIINLETAVTAGDHPWEKGINYRMHPANLPCLSAAGVDCCVLANNHVLDWGRGGLEETLRVLHEGGFVTAGAGHDSTEAESAAILHLGDTRVLVFAFATQSSGVPPDWGPDGGAGVNLLPELSAEALGRIGRQCRALKRPGDLAVASIHWGGNWGYPIPAAHRAFAHGLIDEAEIDLVHGHSSHHVKGFEVYRGKLLLYGCGDFLNDYEGIRGYEQFRADLTLMYLPRLDPASGTLQELSLVPLQIRHLRLNRPPAEAISWLAQVLNREGRPFGTRVAEAPDGTLRWQGDTD